MKSRLGIPDQRQGQKTERHRDGAGPGRLSTGDEKTGPETSEAFFKGVKELSQMLRSKLRANHASEPYTETSLRVQENMI